jgi:phosphatidylglycerophosphatase A
MSTSSRWTVTSSSRNRPLGVIDRLAFVVASVFGAGYSPVASGTVGSLVTAVAIWLLPLPPFRIAVTPLRIAVALVVVILLGIWAGSRVERVLGRKDPGVIVIDEVAGMLLSVVLLPLSIPVLVTAFLLFRLFDIWKPFPARESQALTGGMGVMVDDLIAGLYTLVLVMGARALFGVPA